MFFNVGIHRFLQFPIIGVLSQSFRYFLDGIIEIGIVAIGVLNVSPEGSEFSVVVESSSGVVEGQGFGESIELFELKVAIVGCVFGVDFSEVVGIFFNFADFFLDDLLPVYFFYLFGFQVIFMF